MASVYKRKYRIPEGRADAGQERTARRHSVEFTDHRGLARRLVAFEHRGPSEELGRKLDKLAALRAAGEAPDPTLSKWLEKSLSDRLRAKLGKWGLLDPRSVAGRRKLADHLSDYEQALRDRGVTAAHVRLTGFRIRTIHEGTRAVYPSDVTAAKVAHYLAERRKLTRDKGGLSVASSNHYLATARSFWTWMLRECRATENPLAHVEKPSAATDRRHVRRALEPDELRALLAAVRPAPDWHGVSGEGRYWLYRLAVETGLRANELRSLRRGSLILDGPEPAVTLEAAAAKNRKAARLPLKPDTAAGLLVFLADKAPAASVFTLPRPELMVAMLRADLARAGIEYEDAAGRVADFHSLRGTFVSLLAAAGVPLRTIQELARHSTPVLTMNVYARTFHGSEADAVSRLPDLTQPARQALRAVGTDHARADAACAGGPVGGNGGQKVCLPVHSDARQTVACGNAGNAGNTAENSAFPGAKATSARGRRPTAGTYSNPVGGVFPSPAIAGLFPEADAQFSA